MENPDASHPEVTVALQGTLETFALPEVLRLLASTGKTGRLRVAGQRGTGELWLQDGSIVAAAAPRLGTGPSTADVVFELLRFEAGDFEFDAGHVSAESDTPRAVDELLAEAEEMLAEWREIERVVPSSRHRVVLVRDLPQDELLVDADAWRSIVVVGSGCSVAELGAARSLGELAAARAVVHLTELGLAEVGDPRPGDVDDPAAAPAPAEATASTAVEPVADAIDAWNRPAGVDEDQVAGDDGPWVPVVAATDEKFDPDAIWRDHPTSPAAQPDAAAPSPAVSAFTDDPFGPDPFGSLADIVPGSANGEGDDDAAELARQLGTLSPRAARAVAAAAGAASPEERDAALAEVDDTESVDRGLLLRFLSSVDE